MLLKKISTKAILFIVIILTLLFTLMAQNIANNLNQQDLAINQMIYEKIKKDDLLEINKIIFDTNEGNVTIAGIANSSTDAEIILKLVRSTAGVKNVNTKQFYILESKVPMIDLINNIKIKALLIQEKLSGKNIPLMDINIESNDGVVYLSGTVNNKEQSDIIIDDAKSIKSVRSVVSRIHLRDDNNVDVKAID